MNFDRFTAVIFGFSGLLNVFSMQFEKAEAELSRGLDKCPELAYNWGLRAYVRIRLGDFEGAVSDCTRKILLKPNDASTYALRGWAHYCNQKYSMVIEDLEHSIDLEPERRSNYQDSLRLIDAYMILDQDEKAIALCDEILAGRLEDFYALELYGRKSASLMKRQEYDSCLVALDKAIENATLADKAELHKMKSEVFEALENFESRDSELQLHQNLKKFEAQITEWMPASVFKRTLAGLVDGAVVASLNTLFFVFLITLFAFFGYGALEFNNELVLPVVPYAFFFFGLSLLDSILVFLTPFILTFVILTLSLEIWHGTTDCQMFFLIMLLAIIAINFFYHSWFPSLSIQGTPGKYLLKLRVTDFDGGTLSQKLLLARHAIRIVPSFIFSAVTIVCISYLLKEPNLFQVLITGLVFTITSIFTYGISLKPGLHNLWTNSFVSDVSLYYGGPLRNSVDAENPDI